MTEKRKTPTLQSCFNVWESEQGVLIAMADSADGSDVVHPSECSEAGRSMRARARADDSVSLRELGAGEREGWTQYPCSYIGDYVTRQRPGASAAVDP